MKEVERQKIWEKYTKNPTQEMREQIIIEYAPLVKIVAGRLSMYLGGNVFVPKDEAFDDARVQKFVDKICAKLNEEYGVELRA